MTTTSQTTRSDPTEPPPPAGPAGWTAGRVAAAGASGVGAVIGLALLLGGLALIAVHAFARDDDGYYTTATELLESNSFAITTDEIDLGSDPGGPAPEALLGNLRVRAESTDGGALFVGIGPTLDVDRYLRGVAHAELADFDDGAATYDEHEGGVPASRPGSQGFWTASSEGTGRRSVEWDAESGAWTAAVMNADGRAGISVDADAGTRIGWLLWAGVGLTLLGAVLVAGMTALIIRLRRGAAA